MQELKDFIKSSHIEPSLIRAVVRNMGGWEEFKAHAEDVCNHGGSSGFGAFCYYTYTVKFTKANKKAILKLAEELGNDIGSEGLLEFIASFNCLESLYSFDEVARAIYQGKGEAYIPVFNALSWFALEEVSRSYIDLKDDE